MAVPMNQVVQVDSSSSPSGSTTPTKSGVTSIHVHAASSTPSSEQDTSHKDTSAATPTTMMSSAREFDEQDEMVKRKIKDMQVIQFNSVFISISIQHLSSNFCSLKYSIQHKKKSKFTKYINT